MFKKFVFISLLALMPVQAQTDVSITITIDGNSTTMLLSTDTINALAAFVHDQVDGDGKPVYRDLADLLSKHVTNSLVKPLLQKYNPAVLAALQAVVQAQLAAKAALDNAAVTKQ
jgi:hypothetical protein